MPKTPKVSVITPFFNEERYLAECIESVLEQGYSNFEYILVDNHSTDASPRIAREYADRDDRVRIVRPPVHLDQMPNHDFGLRAISADTDFCKIVQGDDWLFPGCLEQMVSRARDNPSVGIVSAFTMLEKGVYLTGLHPSEAFLSGREVARRFLRDGLYVFGSQTAHLLRADLVRSRDPFYRAEADPFADVDSCLLAMAETDFGFVHQVLTFTRRSNQSMTTARSRYRNTMLLTRYVMLLRHGALFFDPEELEACRRQLSAMYYRSLGEHFWRRMPADFWELQRSCLESAGSPFSRGRTFLSIGAELGSLLLNPLESGRRVATRLRGGEG